VKRKAAPFLTNAFVLPAKLQAWIEAGELSAVARDDSLSLLRRDADFCHLYYFAASPRALEDALAALPAAVAETMVCDLVGKRADIDRVLPLFRSHGFCDYALLYRMVKLAPEPTAAAVDADVAFAEAADAPQVSHLLHTCFDRYAEQLPAPAEIAAAIGTRRLLTVRHPGGIAGFLYFEPAGFTATVRYWFVAPEHRNRGIAARLMRAFFAQCPKAKRILLWVLAENENAIVRYAHFGFAPEDLVDQVMICRKEAG
jgi:GNAT superfamily N-acetyltransferase